MAMKTDVKNVVIKKPVRQKMIVAQGRATGTPFVPYKVLHTEIVDSLDEKRAKQILKAIKSVSKKNKMTVIITTKNNNFIKIANKVITLKNGSLSDLAVNKKIKSIGDISW